MKETVQTRADNVSTYKQILKELYKGGHKTEGRLISKFAKEVINYGFTTQAQERYDKT